VWHQKPPCSLHYLMSHAVRACGHSVALCASTNRFAFFLFVPFSMQLELDAINRIVTVKKEDVLGKQGQVMPARGGYGYNPNARPAGGFGYMPGAAGVPRTPALVTATPMHPSQGGSTPLHPSQRVSMYAVWPCCVAHLAMPIVWCPTCRAHSEHACLKVALRRRLVCQGALQFRVASSSILLLLHTWPPRQRRPCTQASTILMIQCAVCLVQLCSLCESTARMPSVLHKVDSIVHAS
jgi:hypothetical protein